MPLHGSNYAFHKLRN
jgi:hypothetical protein